MIYIYNECIHKPFLEKPFFRKSFLEKSFFGKRFLNTERKLLSLKRITNGYRRLNDYLMHNTMHKIIIEFAEEIWY